MTVISPEQWENDYKPILANNVDEQQRLEELQEKWGEPDEGGRGEFVLVRHDPPSGGSNFNMGSAPKP